MQLTKPRHIFIVGVGRSGTSLLQSMLNAHRDVCFTPETSFVRRFLVKGDLDELWRHSKGAVLDHLLCDKLIGRLGFSDHELREAVDAVASSGSTRELYHEIQGRYAAKQGKDTAKWLGEKDPKNVEYLPLLAKVFPGARVLHIIRDPRDVLASKKRAAWSRERSSLRHIFANRVQMKMARRLGPRLFGPRYMECLYEDLIADAPSVLADICRFLQIDYDEAMLNFSQSSKALVSENEMQWKKETLGPLLKGNTEKWKMQLSARETALTQRMCGEAMKVGGYAAANVSPQLTMADRIGLAASAALISAADPPYRLYRQLSYRL